MLIFAVPNSLIILFVLLMIFAFIVFVVKSLISGCLTLIKTLIKSIRTLIKSYKENEKTRLTCQRHLLSLGCLITLIFPFIIFIFDYPLYYFFLDIAVMYLLVHLNEKWKAKAKKANFTQEVNINANKL